MRSYLLADIIGWHPLGTSPNFGLLFNVFSQHSVHGAVALERGVI
jgi:hypothetical protein